MGRQRPRHACCPGAHQRSHASNATDLRNCRRYCPAGRLSLHPWIGQPATHVSGAPAGARRCCGPLTRGFRVAPPPATIFPSLRDSGVRVDTSPEGSAFLHPRLPSFRPSGTLAFVWILHPGVPRCSTPGYHLPVPPGLGAGSSPLRHHLKPEHRTLKPQSRPAALDSLTTALGSQGLQRRYGSPPWSTGISTEKGSETSLPAGFRGAWICWSRACRPLEKIHPTLP